MARKKSPVCPNPLSEWVQLDAPPEQGHVVTWQGNLLTWKDRSCRSPVEGGGLRGTVLGLSRAARFRLLKLIASIDWTRCLPGLFVEVGYPDEVGVQPLHTVHYHRDRLWRKIESESGGQRACLWRVEFEDRKSGPLLGTIFPHVHFVVCNCSFVDQWKLKEWWRDIIGSSVLPHTDVKPLADAAGAAWYCASYCAKYQVFDFSNDAYSNLGKGRVWGVMRKDLLPFHPRVSVVLRDADEVRKLRDHYTKELLRKGIDSLESFTLLGDMARELGAEIFGEPETFTRE